jgi:hypothetical protein
MTQLVAALAGVAVVRRLAIPDFAIYAVAASVQASLAVMSDIGVSTLLLARAGEFHADLHRVAVLGRTARSFRGRLLVLNLLVAGPLLWVSLGQSRPSMLAWGITLFLITGIVAAQVASSLDGTLLLALLRAERQQLGQLLNALVRLAGFTLLLFAFPSYLVALAINLGAAVLQAVFVRSDLRKRLPATIEKSAADNEAFNRFARSQLVNAAYYAFSSQISIWVVGVLATTRVVAEVGALGRLSNIIVLAQGAIISLVVPRMARYTDTRQLLRRYLQVLGIGVVACVALLVVAFEAPRALLWILGPKYAGLAPVLPIAIGAACTYAISVTIFSLNSAKAWFEHNWVAVPLTIGLQLVCLRFLDVTRLRDALLFGWATVTPPLLVNSIIAWSRFRQRFRVQAASEQN